MGGRGRGGPRPRRRGRSRRAPPVPAAREHPRRGPGGGRPSWRARSNCPTAELVCQGRGGGQQHGAWQHSSWQEAAGHAAFEPLQPRHPVKRLPRLRRRREHLGPRQALSWPGAAVQRVKRRGAGPGARQRMARQRQRGGVAAGHARRRLRAAAPSAPQPLARLREAPLRGAAWGSRGRALSCGTPALGAGNHDMPPRKPHQAVRGGSTKGAGIAAESQQHHSHSLDNANEIAWLHAVSEGSKTLRGPTCLAVDGWSEAIQHLQCQSSGRGVGRISVADSCLGEVTLPALI
mmetsp:Transcript_134019/g.373529  ORF Transcript_134019/g.373529 Transcript_134019/m.373529 type:complete len:291 (+) Transcript_134019:341-1213(+)